MAVFTKSQREKLHDNMTAYLHNFGYIKIVKADYGPGFYVFTKEDEGFVEFCYNVDYLNGWLYGAVQCACNIMRRRPTKDMLEAEELKELTQKVLES